MSIEKQIIERFAAIPSDSLFAFRQAVVEVITGHELETEDFYPLVDATTIAFNEMSGRIDFGCPADVRGLVLLYHAANIESELAWAYSIFRIPLPVARPMQTEPEQLKG